MELLVIMPFCTSKGLNNLLESVENNIPDFVDNTYNIKFLFYTNNRTLYLEARKEIDYTLNSIDIYNLERLITFTPTISFNEAKNEIDRLSDNAFIFLWNENIVLGKGCLRSLLERYRTYPHAGFISGHFSEYPTVYFFEDIYNEKSKRLLWNDEDIEKELINVDTIYPYGIMTKYDNFYNFNFQNDELSGLGFGIWLRKSGFLNYVDTTIKYKYGEK